MDDTDEKEKAELEERKRAAKAMLVADVRAEFWRAGDLRREMSWCHEYVIIDGGR